MTGDRWQEVDGLFRRALERSPGERAPFLARECDGDPELRAAVEDLLQATEETHPFLESSVEDLWDLPWDEMLPRPERPGEGANADGGAFDRSGERLGPYRLLRRLGRGGMATVYLAERADGHWEQRVAIKILRRGVDTEDVVRRFLAERQILSSLDHPNIARLLDGGSTADGLPYLVMEYVEGTPITAYCDESRLPVEKRLELLCDVGRAVQSAHRHLVVHRDLKPSNILVDAQGRPKLLDFGIAKLLDPSGETDMTRAGLRPLTLTYASPEQVAGGAITTASDVYQLGILLCELLAGHRPYEVNALSPARAERAITEAEPAGPSSLVTVETAAARGTAADDLARRLRGDLDTIVLHALRKEPEQRYDSAGALVDDLERHLNGQPVAARPDTLGYRARKFVGRHRAAVAGGVLVGLLLAGSAAVSLVQAGRAERERDRALAEQARTEQVAEFLGDIFRMTDPHEVEGEAITVVELLDIGADRARRELEGDPRTQAEVLSAIGTMYSARGLFDRAAPLLERAIELRRRSDGDPGDLVTDLGSLGYVVGRTDREEGNRFLEEAVALAEREFEADDPRLATALSNLAEGLIQSREPDAAERARSLLDRAIPILRAAEGDVRAELAQALQLSAYRTDGQRPADLDQFEEALELRRSLYGENHMLVAVTLNEMALALEAIEPDSADRLLERAVAISQRIQGPNHVHTIQMMSNLAGRWRDRGDFAKAEPMYRELLRRQREAYPTDSVGHAFRMHGLGWSLTELGRPEEAEPLLRDVLHILEAAGFDFESRTYQMGRSTLGRALAVQGRYAEAEPLLRDSYEWMAVNSPRPVFLRFMLERLIDLYEAWGRPALAAEYRTHRSPLESHATPPDTASPPPSP